MNGAVHLPSRRREFLKQAGVTGLGVGLLAAAGSISAAESQPNTQPTPLSPVDRFNYVVGTQTIGASYQFTEKPRLLEMAEVIRDLGSSVIKLSLNWDKQRGPKPEGIQTLRDVAVRDPVINTILAMPFAYYVLWAYPVGKSDSDSVERDEQLYDLGCHLLKVYSGTGKTFYLGHWEGDWELRGRAGSREDPKPSAIATKIQWLNRRQHAVDDAKKDTPHRDVNVYCYAEVNLVRDAMSGRPAMTNEVIPHTKIDFVSYSAYDTTNEHTAGLPEALDFIETHLPPKPGIPGKRVWVGEYGYPAERFSPQQQDARTREVLKAGLKWGCPFVLFWELYNNEVENDKQRGFWLIDDKGAKQPVYYTHQRLCQWGRRYVAEQINSNGRAPSFEDYRIAAAEFLETI